ncbi:MAG: hypothetical protein WC508_04375 [Patescibacteria group bacterium]
MKDLIKSISKNEWRFLILIMAAMVLITTIPYIFGYFSASPGTVYDGLHALTAGDTPVYCSYINQVKSGNIFLKDLFTSETQDIGTLNIWWLLVGFMAKIFNLSPLFAFQISRIVMVPIFIIIAYLFISYIFTEVRKRKLALIFLLFSSGLGAYFANFFNQFGWENTIPYRWPIDLWLGEAIIFNTLYQTSHFIASITLTLLIFLLVLLALAKNKFSYAVIAGILCLFYFNFHPYYFPVIFGVLGLYLLVLFWQTKKILWRDVGYLLTVFLISLPSVIYHFWLIVSSPTIAWRATQNITLISPPIFVLIGYGFLWLGFGLGLWFLLKNKALENKFIFLLIWLTVNLALAYSAFPFQSRYTQGLQFILVIFTVVGLLAIYDWLKIKLKSKTFDFWVNNPTLLGVLFILLFGTSNLYNLVRDFYYFSYKPGTVASAFYLPKGLVSGIKWTDSLPGPQIILAADIPARFTSCYSGQTVYLGHFHETLFAYSKALYLSWFFADNKNDEKKHQFLIKNNINLVFYSQYEKELGSFNPATKDYLKPIYQNPDIIIYQVLK